MGPAIWLVLAAAAYEMHTGGDARLRELEQAASEQPHQDAQQATLRPPSATEA